MHGVVVGLSALVIGACGPSFGGGATGGGTDGGGGGGGGAADGIPSDPGDDDDDDGGPECNSSSDCAGECSFCNAEGMCEEDVGCCAAAQDEPFGFRCQPPECEVDDDCPTNQTCDGWSCIPDCYTDDDCGDDAQCIASLCVSDIDLPTCDDLPASGSAGFGVAAPFHVAAADLDGDGQDVLWSFGDDGIARRWHDADAPLEVEIASAPAAATRVTTSEGELLVIGYPSFDAVDPARGLTLIRTADGGTLSQTDHTVEDSVVRSLVPLDSESETARVALVPTNTDVEMWAVAFDTVELVQTLPDTAGTMQASTVVLADGSRGLAVLVAGEVRLFDAEALTLTATIPADNASTGMVDVGGAAPAFGHVVIYDEPAFGATLSSVALEESPLPAVPLALPVRVAQLVGADLQGQGRPQLFAALESSLPLTTIRLDDEGAFDCAAPMGVSDVRALAPGDYDGDGAQDIAAVTGDGTVELFFGGL